MFRGQNTVDKAGTFHWFHWLIVTLSLGLTFAAWHFSKSQVEEKSRIRFQKDSNQLVHLLVERLEKYEEALLGGVALIQSRERKVRFPEWQRYAKGLRLQQRYPGINGIGVIHAVEKENLAAYLADQRIDRPDYQIHPPHYQPEHMPISYIIPVQGNEKAVGLDMAHEANRYKAALNAKKTKTSQITGPITLVQDTGKTPWVSFLCSNFPGA